MESLMGRTGKGIIAAWLGLSLSLAFSGCAVGGKSMSIDSTSKMPWFGLELKGRKPKSDGPQFRSVRSEQSDKARLAAALFGDTNDTIGGDLDNDLPRKSATALPMSDHRLAANTTQKDPAEVDFR